MKNRFCSAHAIAALLLLAAACDDGGGSGGEEEDTGTGELDAAADAGRDAGRTDARVPDASELDADEPDGEAPDADTSDGGGEMDAAADADVPDAAPDGGAPDTGSIDAGTDPDTGTTADTGAPDTGAPPACAQAAIVAATGGTITSLDNRFSLTLPAAALSADADVRICLVAEANLPTTVVSDGRTGEVYVIETTATFAAAATATFTGHSALPGPDSATAFNPVTLRSLPAGGAPASGTGAALVLRKGATSALSSTRLSARIAAPGYVYVAPLEATGVYQVELASPKTTYVTGEVIELGAHVEVVGTPAVARTLALNLEGCNTEIIELDKGQATTSAPGCPVLTTSPTLGSEDYIDGSPALTDGREFELGLPAGAGSAPRFFCKFPETAKATARLSFVNGATTDLTVTKELNVTCTYSGDLLAVYDQLAVTNNGGDLELGTSYTSGYNLTFAPPTLIQLYDVFGTDGVIFNLPEPVPTQTPVPNLYITGPTPPNKSLTLQVSVMPPREDLYVPSPAFNPATPFFGPTGGAGGVADVRLVSGAGTPVASCDASTAAQLTVDFGARNGTSTTIGFNDATVDAVSIAAVSTGTTPVALQRWVRAEALGLGNGRAEINLLTTAQQAIVAQRALVFQGFAVSLYDVTWNEGGALWPDGVGTEKGRVMPFACGTTLLISAAALGL